MSIAHAILLNYGKEKEETSNEIHKLGTLGISPGGEMFRYCFSNGAITAGNLLQTAVPVAADDMDVVVAAAAAIGVRAISITTAGAIVANLYNEGLAYVNFDPGQGQRFRLGEHLAADSAATLVLNLATDEQVRTALSTSSLVGLKVNRFKDVIIFPTTVTGFPVGFTTFDVADDRYFWAQTRGEASLEIQGTVVLGKQAIPSASTAGAIQPSVDAGGDDPVVAIIGNPIAVNTDCAHGYICIE